jgi:hypothetical protein
MSPPLRAPTPRRYHSRPGGENQSDGTAAPNGRQWLIRRRSRQHHLLLPPRKLKNGAAELEDPDQAGSDRISTEETGSDAHYTGTNAGRPTPTGPRLRRHLSFAISSRRRRRSRLGIGPAGASSLSATVHSRKGVTLATWSMHTRAGVS